MLVSADHLADRDFQVPAIPAPIVPSSGPQRSGKGAKGKGKATQKGKGRRKRDPTKPLPTNIDKSWEETKERLFWKMSEMYYLQPPGGVINPETAFANTINYVKEDIHRSVSDLFTAIATIV